MDKKLKLKHWWWHLFTPKDFLIDLTVLRMSASNSANAKITEKLREDFYKKWYKV